jgi:HEAT repeat protein
VNIGKLGSLALVAAALSLVCGQDAWSAAARRGGGKGARGKTELAARPALSEDVLAKLRVALAGDEETALEAARALGESRAPNAAVPLVEALGVGARPSVAVAAIDALGKLTDPVATEVLVLYAGHRNPDVRRQATRALGALSPKATVTPTLLERLGDAAPDVRAAAAEALAGRGEKQAAPRLFALFKLNDAGAAAPLGLLAPTDMVPAIAELRGAVDDAHLATALGEFVKRADASDRLRVEVLRTLGKVHGAAATTALVEYLATIPAGVERPSRKEAQKLIDERSKQP